MTKRVASSDLPPFFSGKGPPGFHLIETQTMPNLTFGQLDVFKAPNNQSCGRSALPGQDAQNRPQKFEEFRTTERVSEGSNPPPLSGSHFSKFRIFWIGSRKSHVCGLRTI
jgi:hypothetical protein